MALPSGTWLLNSMLIDELPMEGWVGGAASRIHTADDRWYIDMFGDDGTVSIGYTDIERPLHVMQIVPCPIRDEAARVLAESCGLDWTFFINSGTEGVETMMKFARRASGRTLIYALDGEFYGCTYGAMSASFSAPYHRQGYGPFLPGVAPFKEVNDIDSNAAAVIITPAMVNKDFRAYDPDWLSHLVGYCRANRIFICVDEAQTFLRLGRVWGHQVYGFKPDMLCTANGVAGGYPAGAVCGRASIGMAIQKGGHFSTFGGSPAACGLMVHIYHTYGNDEYLAHIRALGNYMKSRLREVEGLKVRGEGMMIAADCGCDMFELRNRCLARGVILGIFSRDQALKLTPPLTITVEELKEAMDIIVEELNILCSL